MKRSTQVMIVALLVAAAALVGAVVWPVLAQTGTPSAAAGQPAPTGQPAPSIAVSGHGEVQAQPDQAVIRLGVQTDANTATQALQQNSQAMQKLLDALRAAGLSGQALQTQQVQLQPRYSNPGQQGGTPEVVGYTAVNVVQARVQDLSRLGQVLDAAVAAGGNRIDSLQFVVSNPAQSAAQARQAAWNDALSKAQQLAGLAGASLGPVFSITESGGVQPPVPVRAAAPAAGGGAVPVEPGTQTVTADIQVTWMLIGGGPGAAATLIPPTAGSATALPGGTLPATGTATLIPPTAGSATVPPGGTLPATVTPAAGLLVTPSATP